MLETSRTSDIVFFGLYKLKRQTFYSAKLQRDSCARNGQKSSDKTIVGFPKLPRVQNVLRFEFEHRAIADSPNFIYRRIFQNRLGFLRTVKVQNALFTEFRPFGAFVGNLG